MTLLLWGILALVAGLAVPAGLILAFGRRAPALDEDLPVTPLQRLARWGLAAGLVLSAGAGAVVGVFGPERTFDETAPRIGFELLVLAVLGVLLFLTARSWVWSRREDGTLDERDRGILGGAHAVQVVAMLATVAVWTIGLQEHFGSEGQVPVPMLALIFWSCVVASVLALPLGILLGYRRG